MMPATLGELVRQRALERSGAIAYGVLDEDAAIRDEVSYEALYQSALRVAAMLRRRVAPRARVLLAYPNGIEFLAAFFGAVLADTIAVPVPLPKRNRSNERFKSIVRDARPSAAMTPSAWTELLVHEVTAAGADAVVLATDGDEADACEPRESQESAGPAEIAYLQYTSGSIAEPKGVVITHANVLTNAAIARFVEENDETSVSLTWLPNFHDMGLVEGLLQPLFSGVPGLIMTPAAFLQRPRLWLEAITRHRVTNSGAPNFAYELCVDKADEGARGPLDLRSWRVAYNGAEPIRHETLQRFLERFAADGFEERAFYPVYGLAEATLVVTSGRREDLPFRLTVDRGRLEHGDAVTAPDGAPNACTLVASGALLTEDCDGRTEVVIVDPSTGEAQPGGVVGEVYLAGPSIAAGYWNRPVESRETFGAAVRGRSGTFARTGDLGFVWDGSLFLTGRTKDLIITKGRNLHPHDLEWLASTAHEEVRPWSCAAFALTGDDDDRIVMVCETSRRATPGDLRAVAAAIDERISTELDIELHDVVFIRAGMLPKTSSGKVQRLRCRDLLASGELAAEYSRRRADAATRDDEDAALAGSRVLEQLRGLLTRGRPGTSIPDDGALCEYVNDSLSAVKLCHEVEHRFGVIVPVSSLLGQTTLASLASRIAAAMRAPKPATTGAASAPAQVGARGGARDAAGLIRLSYGQEALWSIAAVAPSNRAYHLCRVLEIAGPLDAGALRRALDLLTARHAVLRTRFEVVDGVPHQAFDSSHTIEWVEADFTAADAAAVSRYGEEHAWRPFDLEHDSPIRLHLLKRDAQSHLLLIAIHHIVSDLWSFAQVLQELFLQYDALTSGRWLALPPPAVDFPDLVRAEREDAPSDATRASWAREQARLRALPVESALPLDRPRPPLQTFDGGAIDADLDAALAARIAARARELGTTPFCVMLATWLVLVHRLTGQAAVAVGVPMAGRTHPSHAGVLGFLVNVRVLGSELAAGERWRDVFARTHAQMLSAHDAEHIPLRQLMEEAGAPRDPRVPPVFQQMFSLETPPRWEALAPLVASRAGGEVECGTLTLRAYPLPEQGAQVDLHARFVPHEGRLLGTWTFNTDLFDASTVQRWAATYTTLLQAALDAPDGVATRLPAHEAEEGTAPHGVHGEQATDEGEPAALHALVEAQAGRTPDRVAVSFDDGVLTYAGLMRQARTVARALRRRGIGAEDCVAVCLDRSLELPIALLGILQAAASFLPVATDYPRARIEQLVAAARARLVIVPDAFRESCGAAAVRIGELLSEQTDEVRAPGPPLFTGSGTHAAYVIFTSGSTGQPKGAVNTHAGIVNRLRWMQRAYGLTAEDRVLLKTPYTFDVSVWELFWPLTAGAQCVVARPGVQRDVAALTDVVTEREVTMMHFVPSMLSVFAPQTDAVRVKTVRALFCSGEVLSKAVHAEACGVFSGAIHNLYGPTEAAIDVTAWRCAPDYGGSTIPIGSPIANTTLYILDDELLPVIPGASGDLYIAGIGLARGYAGQPAATAVAFIPDMYAATPGGRLYRTGDRARVRGDGALEFLGRRDLQVKVRGHRVEPQEIETQLSAHPEIAAAAVFARGDGERGTRLVACYVAREGTRVSSRAVRSWLAARLPDYMIPALIAPLSSMPLLESGKIDRRALPTIDTASEAEGALLVAPRTAAEATLAEIWRDVLGVRAVGVTDTFFELGGDSLLVVRAAAKARARGFGLTAAEIYQDQTIERICARLNGREAPPASADEGGLYRPFSLIDPDDARRVPADVDDAMPLARLQEGMVYHLETSENYIAYVATVHVRGPFRWELWEQVVDTALARHPYLRVSIARAGFLEPLQLVHRQIPRPLYVEDIRHLSAAAQRDFMERWIAAEKKRRFAWDAPPLFRLTLHRRTEETFQITLTEVTLDGWSIALLLSELCRGYQRLLQGEPVQAVEAMEPSYGSFVQLERQAMQDEASAAFWRRRANPEGVAPLPRWPARWRSSDRTRHDRRTVDIDTEVVNALRARANEAGVPLKSVLLAAHAAVLRTLTGRDDVLTELITHGRLEEPGGDAAIGLYTNTVPMQMTLHGRRWRELIQQAYDAEVELYPHRRYPFADIHRHSRNPVLRDAAFNFTHFHVAADLLAGGGPLEMLDVRSFDQTYFALTAYFNLQPVDGRLSIDLDYAPTELAGPQIALTAGYYTRACRAIAETPDATLAETDLLAPEERARELQEWGVAAPLASPLPDPIDAIDDHSRATPDRVAIVHDGEAVTYRALRQRSAALASRLRALGVGPEAGVGVLLDRSPDFVIAVLAILECGGFFVPLDRCDAPERRAHMIRASELRAIVVAGTVVAGTGEAEGEAEIESVRQISCTVDASRRPARPVSRRPVPPDALAYCIYTSGSTGEPKGVDVPRRALAAFVPAAAAAYGFTAQDRVLQFAALSFDAAFEEIFCALCTGATLVLRPPRSLDSFRDFLEACARDAVTVLDLPTAFWHQLTGAMAPNGASNEALSLSASVGTVILGGEKVIARRAAEWCDTVGDRVTLHNSYGPTEATIVALQQRLDAGARESSPNDANLAATMDVPIGRPLAGTAAYVLSAAGEIGPVGRPGELCLGGPALARGYRGRGDLTAERFRPNPFGDPGSRLYWTGDLVERRPDGAVDYVGRVDAQLKIRGFRVEPSEIEAVLESDARVGEAAVIAWTPDADATPVLIAYVAPAPVTQDAARDLVESLSGVLRRKLPSYMMPARIETIAALPLTASGKVDRAALQARASSTTGPGGVDEPAIETPAADGPVAETVRAIVRTCLGVEPRAARFTELGGDSLSAMKVASRVEERLHVRLAVRDIFDAPHVAALADRVAQARRLGAGLPQAPVLRAEPGQPLEMSFAQERLWFLHQFDPASTSYNVPAAFWIEGALNVAALHQAIQNICRRHQVLQTRFVDRGASSAPIRVSGLAVPVSHVDLRQWKAFGRAAPDAATATADMARAIARREAARAFDLARDSLIRVTVVQTGDHDYLLVVVMHHIVTDEWCAEIFIDEFRRFYEAAATGRPPSLPDLPVQYTDYARWQRQMLTGPRLAALTAFWRRELAGAPPLLRLPLDVPRERASQPGGGRQYFEIDPRVTQGLRALGRRHDASSFMVLIAVYQLLLHSVSGMDDILVGSPMAGRTSPGTEKLIGFFANLIVLRTRLRREHTFASHLASVRETTLACYDHHELSFAQLVSVLNPERSAAHAPIVQVIFGLWPASHEGLRVAGLRLRRERLHAPQAKYDLEMQLADGGRVLAGFLEYNAVLFVPSTIARLVATYQRLCEAVVDRPSATLLDLVHGASETAINETTMKVS